MWPPSVVAKKEGLPVYQLVAQENKIDVGVLPDNGDRARYNDFSALHSKALERFERRGPDGGFDKNFWFRHNV